MPRLMLGCTRFVPLCLMLASPGLLKLNVSNKAHGFALSPAPGLQSVPADGERPSLPNPPSKSAQAATAKCLRPAAQATDICLSQSRRLGVPGQGAGRPSFCRGLSFWFGDGRLPRILAGRGREGNTVAFKGTDHREAPASLPSKHQGLQILSHSGLGFQPKQAMASTRIPDGAIPLGGRHPCLCTVGSTRPARPSRGFPGRAPWPTPRPRPSLASVSTSSPLGLASVTHVCVSHGNSTRRPGATGKGRKGATHLRGESLCFNLRGMQ